MGIINKLALKILMKSWGETKSLEKATGVCLIYAGAVGIKNFITS